MSDATLGDILEEMGKTNKFLERLAKGVEDLVLSQNFPRASQLPKHDVKTASPDVATLGDWQQMRGGGHWIFANKNAPLRDTLLAARAQGKDHVDMGGYRFRLSGNQDKFINRFPLEAPMK